MHQECCHVSGRFVQLGFNNRANAGAFGVGFDGQLIRDKQDRFKQVIQAAFRLCGNRQDKGVAFPFHRLQTDLSELTHNAVWVGIVFVDLIECHHNRNLGGFGMIGSFASLRLNAVICRHHQYDDIRALSTPGTHRRKRRVTRRVEERDYAVLMQNLIRADMLRDPAHFTASHIRMADGVEQRGFAVVYMPQDCHNRGTRLKVFWVFLQNNASPKGNFSLFFNNNFFLFQLGFVTKFGCNHRGGVKIDLLVDARHDTVGHQNFDDRHGAGAQ